jgi:hypothetical protein
MKNRLDLLALATALVSFGLAGSASAQLNLPGLTPQDPSILSCASINGQRVRCPLPANTTAVFLQQTSNAACTRGSTYVIDRDAITVSNGCRAEFRLTDVELSGTALTAQLRSQIERELSQRLRTDYRLSSAPSIELRNDSERFLSSTEVGYSGQVRVVLDQNTAAKTIAFDSVYGTRTHAFSNITYRVVSGDSGPGNGDAAVFTELLRTRLRTAMLARLAMEAHSHTPRFRISTDRQRSISSSETRYSGQGEIMLDGSNWRSIEFDSVYDVRSDRIRDLTYRPADGNSNNGNDSGNSGWRDGVSLDENNLVALAAALAAEVRSQKGGGKVQIVINWRYQEAAAGTGTYHYRGKFGYSFNDASWVTRYFNADMSLTQNKVQNLRISKARSY